MSTADAIARLLSDDTFESGTVPTPGAKNPLLFVSFSYDRGNEYARRRGFYLSLTPGSSDGMFNTLNVSEGARAFVSPAPIARTSKKARLAALDNITPEFLESFVERVIG